jgi:DNA-binding response OmpR family regulator
VRKRVLVVDDNPPLLDLLREALTREGFSVATAENGAEAILAVHNEKPDLVILDVIMPVMDGFQVLRVLREKPETKGLPVIMLTVRKDIGDVLAGWMGGSDLYMPKPCSIEDLIAGVKQVLSGPAEQ